MNRFAYRFAKINLSRFAQQSGSRFARLCTSTTGSLAHQTNSVNFRSKNDRFAGHKNENSKTQKSIGSLDEYVSSLDEQHRFAG